MFQEPSQPENTNSQAGSLCHYDRLGISKSSSQKLFESFPSKIHRSGSKEKLNAKKISINVSFSEDSLSVARAQELIGLEYGGVRAKEAIPLDYSKAGALPAFLTAVESASGNQGVIFDILKRIATLGLNGRWQVRDSFLAVITNRMMAAYAVAWAA